MDSRDTAPDSWELEEDAEAPATAELQSAFAAFNVNATPFVPNVNATVFVPTFPQSSPAETSVSDGEGKFPIVEVSIGITGFDRGDSW